MLRFDRQSQKMINQLRPERHDTRINDICVGELGRAPFTAVKAPSELQILSRAISIIPGIAGRGSAMLSQK